MRNITLHIMSLMFTMVFLLSVAGIRLVVHHCDMCNSVDVSIFGQLDACCSSDIDGKPDDDCQVPIDESTSCCHIPAEENSCNSCCNDHIIYLKKDFELTHARQNIRIEPLVIAYFTVVGVDADFILKQSQDVKFQEFTRPPPRMVGKDFVLYSHQIKIG